MNDKVKALIKQCETLDGDEDGYFTRFDKEKFADLLLKEILNETQKVWYQLNDAPLVEGETPRDIGIRVGQKGGVIKVAQHIRKHFGVGE